MLLAFFVASNAFFVESLRILEFGDINELYD